MNPYIRHYLKCGLLATPEVIATLLSGIDSGNDIWDVRPDPDRFTLREVLAHLADWEVIWLSRMTRIIEENVPDLPGIDEGEMAIDNDYGAQDPLDNQIRFKEGREKLVAFLERISDDDWRRVGIRSPDIGRLPIDEMAAMVLGHDGYHTLQIVDWLGSEP